MASPAPCPVLAERADIHKSCKSIETLLNTLNEYCEAAGAVVALQKKLAKALRDTAAHKVTGEISANAMNASASIYDSLSDIDSKFSRIADKEYDLISAEVKKWFKKLAKEEKAHDERISNANAKIKQAGQTYEKKSKKKTTDAGEEHARYINLISTLGPEVSQEKYNHALNVTQKHLAITYNVAASLSRLADTEWQKSCECIRKFSPAIGPLGQWRALCEGGWTGPIPGDLPDTKDSNDAVESEKEPTNSTDLKLKLGEDIRQPQQVASLSPEPRIPPPGYSTGPPSASASSNDLLREQTAQQNSPKLSRQQYSTSSHNTPAQSGTAAPTTSEALEPPKLPFVDTVTGSVRSLSAFPVPPNHFPIPPPRSQNSSQFLSSVASSSNLDIPSESQFPDSPVSANEHPSSPGILEELYSRANKHGSLDSPVSPPSPEIKYRDRPRMTDGTTREQYIDANGQDIQQPIPSRPQTTFSIELINESSRDKPTLRREVRHVPSSSADLKYRNAEPPRRRSLDQESQGLEAGTRTEDGKVRTTSNAKHPRLERMDTGESRGSIVAEMRNRYSSNPESASPPPRDVPRLPLSVNDLATRYQATDAPLSPRHKAALPPVLRQQSLPLLETTAHQVKESYQDRSSGQSQSKQEQDKRRQLRYDDKAEAERKAKEQSLRERERELEIRARELERDRARLQTLLEDDRRSSPNVYREGSNSGQAQSTQFGLRPRERRTSLRHQLQRPLSQMDLEDLGELTPRAPSGAGITSTNRQHSDSAKHMALHSSSGVDLPLSPTRPLHSPKAAQNAPRAYDLYPSNSAGSNSNTSSYESATSHASYCGCETCSVNKYKYSGSSTPKQQSNNAKSEKPTRSSWIRRLSMPVGNAFSLDSKRHQNSNSTGNIYGLGSGVENVPTGPSRGLFFMDGKKNASTTALLSSSTSGESGLAVQEDGRLRHGRRSLETSGGNNNRSMTNLGNLGLR
ncbi:hypothetical protein JR316_0005919 [Psilocybe cubensis]|uniref:Uncharacterized protein n=2 Tax=Psilocybe cubensis TaxID=181762 RepID=A0A8H7XY85_PSICU|nr:hypothetical protein JR316_0005919 [Psilocybe cubensis]KAH9481393.1 hypothetical protein JR316_0005919 [Psilocybe cubensis]